MHRLRLSIMGSDIRRRVGKPDKPVRGPRRRTMMPFPMSLKTFGALERQKRGPRRK